jgi:hypothetical protein
VTKQDLLTAAWPQTAVSDTALSKWIQELRRALGDDAHTPHFLVTGMGRGFASLPPSGIPERQPRIPTFELAMLLNRQPCISWARETELQQLQSCFEAAQLGS